MDKAMILAELRKEYEPKVMEATKNREKVSVTTPKLAALAKISAKFGCHSANVRELLETLTGEKLPAEITRKYPVGCAVVVEKNTNGHNYRIGVAEIAGIVSEGTCFVCVRQDGTFGNYLQESDCRPATEAEISAFFDGATIQTYCKLDEIIK